MNLEKALFNLPLIHHNSNGLSQPKWQFSDRYSIRHHYFLKMTCIFQQTTLDSIVVPKRKFQLGEDQYLCVKKCFSKSKKFIPRSFQK